MKIPVVYKFATTGGPFTNYRIEVEVFRASDDTSLTDGVKFSFSPDADDVTYADVSTIIKAFLKAEWSNPAAINEIETDTFLKFYIKYQELYDGSAVAVVDDVANPRYAVFGALQIPSTVGNNLSDYVPGDDTKQFLTVFDRPRLWKNPSGSGLYPPTLSFIYPDGLPALYVYTEKYNSAAALYASLYWPISSANDDAVNRLDIDQAVSIDSTLKTLKLKLVAHGVGAEILTNPSFVGSLAPWTNIAIGTNWAWNAGEYAECATLPSSILSQIIGNQAVGWYVVEYDVDPGAVGCTITIQLYDNGALVMNLFSGVIASGARETYTKLANPTAVFDEVRISVTPPSGTPDFKIYSFSLKPFAPTDYTDLLTIDVETPCDNPILLIWKNSLGGDAQWLFDYDQEISYSLSGKKAKRMVLHANDLTTDQWEALNELNHLGEIYRHNITEFTSSVNKSHLRDGFQAYVVDASGNKTGVIIIPTQNVMFSRMTRHQFRIEIEYPERYE